MATEYSFEFRRPHFIEKGIDTTIDDLLWRTDLIMDNTHIFHFSPLEVKRYKSLGVKSVTWLPLAANVERFKPYAEIPEFSCDVSFIGHTATVNRRSRLISKFQARLMSRESSVDEKNDIFRWVRRLERIIERHEDRLTEWLIPQFWEEIVGGSSPPDYLGMSVAEICYATGEEVSARQRGAIIAALAGLNINLWGDEGWKAYETLGARYRGFSNYHAELPMIYSSSKINLHTNRIYHQDVTPLRIFDVLACRGFLLADHRDAYADCYDIGKDFLTYQSVREAGELADYYLTHDNERRAIAESGYRATVERHSLAARWKTIIATLQEAGVAPRTP